MLLGTQLTQAAPTPKPLAQNQVVQSAQGLIQRTLPTHANQFVLETIPLEKGKDVFEIEGENGKVVLRGSSGVAISSALNWYLKYECFAHISWCGDQLNLPKVLPQPKSLTRKVTPYTYRYAFNYCTYGYTMAFWDWARWEKELDFMALNGINFPLAATGAEVVVRNVYKQLGVSDQEIGKFISGPAYLGWFLMGNLDGWGGPLPDGWYKKQEILQKKILSRARALGMKPVLPTFAGHVPASLVKKFPKAKIQRMKSWSGFPGTYVLDANDPLFKKIGSMTLKETIKLYGTDHYYSADTFNELHPPSLKSDYLKGMTQAVYESMHAVDPKAVWVMQGWLFNDRGLWTQPRINALLSGCPDDKMIILDLFATAKHHWTHTEAFGGKPWIWCMLHNWGGKQGMYGRMPQVAEGLPNALNNPKSKNLVGMGSTNEGGEVAPVIFDQLYEMTWHDKPVNLHKWIEGYTHRRYGKVNKDVNDAWHILLNTLYNCKNINQHGPLGSFLTMRPHLGKGGGAFVRSPIFYDYKKVQKAFKLLLKASDQLGDQETYQHDVVDLARQVMSDLSQKELHVELRNAYKAKDAGRFDKAAKQYLEAIKDVDALLLTNRKFLLGHWLGMAKNKAAGNATEAKLYEKNARNIITTWGNKNSNLHDYAQRQYGGMMGDFNYTRWKMFLDHCSKALNTKKPFNSGPAEKRIRNYEEKWISQQNTYPTKIKGNAITEAKKIAEKYLK